MFSLYVQVEVYQNILKLKCWPLMFILYKGYLKNKKRSGTSFPISCFACFLTKIFLMLYFIIWPNFIVRLPLLLEILGNMCIAMICCPVCDVITFEINYNFVIKPFFNISKKSEKNVNNSGMERAFNMKSF